LSLPGSAFAAAMNSCSVLKRESPGTIRPKPWLRVISMIGVKPSIGS